jgi:hypothetical protein
MRSEKFRGIVLTIVAITLIVLLAVSGFAQGRGRGGGGGGGRGSGGGAGASTHGGPPSGIGVDRGLGTSSERSGGRADTGRGKASDKSGGRSDAGLERARLANENMRRANDELRRYPRLTSALHTNANDLRSGYQAALVTNPNLKFGNYVAATRLAQNLRSRRPAITRTAILDGLAAGNSIGETLQDLGLSEREANEARKRADREIKLARQ